MLKLPSDISPTEEATSETLPEVRPELPEAPAKQGRRKVLPETPDVDSDEEAPEDAPPQTTDANAALVAILEPLSRGEGFRHGWLGDTRMGKTYANRALMEHAFRRGVALSITLDDKGPSSQYPGTVRANTADLKSNPPSGSEDPCRIVLRGHTLRTGKVCTPDEIAKAVLDELRADRILVSIDELRRAASPAGREWRGAVVPRLFSEGGGLGVSVTWTTQSPQRIPLEAFDQSETLGIFRARGRAVHYLAEQLFLDSDMVAVLPSLRVGQWVLYRKSEPWDGRIYKF